MIIFLYSYIFVTKYEYYPYGLPTHASNSQINKYLFGEKELELRQGLNVYDFLARTYAPDEARFWQPDPNSGDYHWLSPYSYCGGDPVNRVDSDGKDIAVLLNIGGTGHLAMLIQNSDETWSYYSVNGKKMWYISSGTSGGPHNDVAVGSWGSPQEFLEQAQAKIHIEPCEEYPSGMTIYKYDEAYVIETTPEQDKKAAETFTEIAKESYNLVANNCAHAVQRSISAIGINVSDEITTMPMQVSMSANISTYIEVKPYRPMHLWPSTAFKSIVKQNPNGKHYFNKKK